TGGDQAEGGRARARYGGRPDRRHAADERPLPAGLMPLDVLVTGPIATFAGASGYGWAEAVGIKDGRVAFAGSAVELETRADPHTRRFELEPGEIAVPGLTDAHLHLAEAALAADQIDLTNAATLPE